MRKKFFIPMFFTRIGRNTKRKKQL